VGIIYCQDDDNPPLIENEPDVQVILSVDTRPKTSIDVPNDQTSKSFACYECTNCNRKADLITRVCESGINMCYVNFFRNLISNLFIYLFI
jgi:hypothetical protein